MWLSSTPLFGAAFVTAVSEAEPRRLSIGAVNAVRADASGTDTARFADRL